MKILVIEDDAKIASFVAKGLREAGYTVDLSANGEEGCELACKKRYAAAIGDRMLPKLAGLGVIERWRHE